MDISEREGLAGDGVVNGEPGRNQGLTRRRRTIAEKRRVVEETMEPGASVARVARAHEVNANQVFHWRRLYERGRLGPALVKKVVFKRFMPRSRNSTGHLMC
jgi:transposase-like protein